MELKQIEARLATHQTKDKTAQFIIEMLLELLAETNRRLAALEKR